MHGQADLQKIENVGVDGYVSADDVVKLRREIFADGVVNSAELDALFALAAKAPDGDREWLDYFAEAAADFYLREEEPNGYLTEQEFESLKGRIESADAFNALTQGLLVRLIDQATQTPKAMSAFTGSVIKRSIIDKPNGPRVDARDVDAIRKYIFAVGGDGNIAVTRAEAEWLFDLNDAVSRAENDPAWPDLFKKAVANCLMAHIGYQPMSREDAITLHEEFLDDSDRKFATTPRGLFNQIKVWLSDPRVEVEKRHREITEQRTAEAAEAEEVTLTEAEWLYTRIAEDRAFDATEKALMRHLKSLGAKLPPRLQALVDKAA